VLVTSGAHKADAVTAAVTGPVTEACPASVLQRHPSVTVVADRAAAGDLVPHAGSGGRQDWLH
jgi:glucosamine-6-phosphate deaminase